jgi:hypothetical protein
VVQEELATDLELAMDLELAKDLELVKDLELAKESAKDSADNLPWTQCVLAKELNSMPGGGLRQSACHWP